MLWPANPLSGHLAGHQPPSACRPQLHERPLLVAQPVLFWKDVRPSAVDTFVNENLGSSIPKCPAEWHALRRVGFHVGEAAMFEDPRPQVLIYRNLQKRGDLADL